ncbi:cupin domain-containing protein [Verrucomicrobium sp. BvORR106]|uniref:cupin domain-containing protein n=1 Tax=Verrucomicrobium sp. BvORR106 TaxID=1403819 RepID=UPI00068CF333|nr:cupin domain-containing protein [Verrucomicrobium sp. BvORR106]
MSTTATAAPWITRAGESQIIHAFGDEMHIHLGARETGGQYTLFTDVTPPGGGPPPHLHHAEDEWFHVLEGRAAFLKDGVWEEVPAGSTVFMPKGSVHTFKNVGDGPLKQLITVVPAGIENYFARCGEEFAKPDGPDMAGILAISAEHDIVFV